MTTDRLTSSQRAASELFLGEHGGWGLGLGVPGRRRLGPTAARAASGGTAAPAPRGAPTRERGVTGILFTQRAADLARPPPLIDEFWAGVDAALTPRDR